MSSIGFWAGYAKVLCPTYHFINFSYFSLFCNGKAMLHSWFFLSRFEPPVSLIFYVHKEIFTLPLFNSTISQVPIDVHVITLYTFGNLRLVLKHIHNSTFNFAFHQTLLVMIKFMCRQYNLQKSWELAGNIIYMGWFC